MDSHLTDNIFQLHRWKGNILERYDDEMFKNTTVEELVPRFSQIDEWIASPDTSDLLQDILREMTELKKLNANLIKANAIDDLIGDTYTAIYERIGPTLTKPQAEIPERAPSAPPERVNMMSLNNLMNMDGAEESKPAPVPSVRVVIPIKQPRFKAITRREILKRAIDASTTTKPAASTKTSTRQAEQKVDSKSVDDGKTTSQREDSALAPTNGTKPDGSVQGSADDSELSEAADDDDDIEMGQETITVTRSRPLFPNLGTSKRDDKEEERADPDAGDGQGKDHSNHSDDNKKEGSDERQNE